MVSSLLLTKRGEFCFKRRILKIFLFFLSMWRRAFFFIFFTFFKNFTFPFDALRPRGGPDFLASRK